MLSNQHETKRCMICGGEFERMDFPSCFDRMVTCGNTECEGKRRKEMWNARNSKYKKTGRWK